MTSLSWPMLQHATNYCRVDHSTPNFSHPQSLSRSKRPWRTLFERSLGSLPHGAILSLAEQREDVDGHGATAGDSSPAGAPVGKVVWANEGFERLAGVDAADVVGQHLASLFEVGLDEGTELTRSLELGQVGCRAVHVGTGGEHVTFSSLLIGVRRPTSSPLKLHGQYILAVGLHVLCFNFRLQDHVVYFIKLDSTSNSSRPYDNVVSTFDI